MDDGGGASPAIVDIRLVAAHWCVLGIGPIVPDTAVGHRPAHGDVELVANGDGLTGFLGLGEYVVCRVPAVAAEVFGTGPVVMEVDDEGVVELLCFFEGLDDIADSLVHVVDHRGVDRHVADTPWLVVYGVPWLDAILERGEGPAFLVNDAHFEHAGVALVAQLLPAALIHLDVFLNGFLGSVDGPVGGGEGDVLKERLVGLGECLDLAGGLNTYPVGIVVVLLVDLDKLGVAGQGIGVEEGTGTGHSSVEIIEPALNGSILGGILAQVPLPHHSRLIADRLEKFGDGDLAVAETVTIDPSHKSSPGRPATSSIVKLGETEAVRSEAIEIGRVDLASKATKIGKAHVVGQDDQNVRSVCSMGKKGKVEEEKRCENMFHA